MNDTLRGIHQYIDLLAVGGALMAAIMLIEGVRRKFFKSSESRVALAFVFFLISGVFVLIGDRVGIHWGQLVGKYGMAVSSIAAAFLLAKWQRQSSAMTREALEEAARELEIRVQERTSDLQQTTQKLTEALSQLKEREEQYRLLADATPVLVWSAHPDGRVNHYSSYWQELTGMAPEESLGQGWAPAIHPEDFERVRENWMHCIETGEEYNLEFRIRRAFDGEYRWHLGRARARRDAAGQIVHWHGTTSDIHDEIASREERQRLIRQLENQEHELRELINLMPQLAWMSASSGEIIFFNKGWESYTGVTLENGANWVPSLHPDDQAETVQLWEKALASGDSYSARYRLREKATGVYRWFLARANPLRDADGKVLRWFGTTTDIDERQRAEEALMRANEDLEHFASAASHDLVEPLRAISMQAELLAKRESLAESHRQTIFEITGSAKRMAQLLRSLRIYVHAGRGEFVPEEVDTARMLAAVRKDLQPLLVECGGVVEGFGLQPVMMNADHLYQLFLNLITNAVKYPSEGLRPQVRVSMVEEAQHWQFSVADNGCGIAAESQQRIFSAFHRLHSPSQAGSGLGLAICARLVQRYGGKIWVNSDGVNGSIFSFTICKPD